METRVPLNFAGLVFAASGKCKHLEQFPRVKHRKEDTNLDESERHPVVNPVSLEMIPDIMLRNTILKILLRAK